MCVSPKLGKTESILAVLKLASWLILSIGMPAWSFGQATEVTYVIDPSQSVLIASGTCGGQIVQSRGTGVGGVGMSGTNLSASGLVTSYFGTVTADRNYQADTLTITDSNIAAQQNAFADVIGGGLTPIETTSNEDYSFFALSAFPPSGATLPGMLAPNNAFLGGIENLSFSISGVSTISATSLDTSQLSTAIISGQFDGEV
jgi:hypothetical protein